MNAIQQSVQILGSQKALADAIGVSQAYVSHFMTGRRTVTPELCVRIEKATRGKVKRKTIRPDIFGNS